MVRSKSTKKIIPYVNLSHDNNSEPVTNALEYGLRNTILVPMPMNTSSTWKDLAFLAAVPAGMKINRGTPSVIAMPDNENVSIYHYNYLDRYKPTNVFAIGNVPGYSGAVQLNTSSLDDLCCDLARRFWQRSDTVVIVEPSYHIGLSTSALAARLNVPLFYLNNTTISAKTMDCFKNLGVKKAIYVGSYNNIAGQLNGAGIEVETIPNIEKIISWLVANGHEIDYFAVCNSYHRTSSYAPRSALAAPILAAGRSGVVVPLNMPIEFQTPCVGLTETQQRPNGAAMSQPSQGKNLWKVGSCKVNGKNYNFAISRKWADDENFSQGNIDFNGDGNYSDNYFVNGEKRNFGGKEYLIGLKNWQQYPDLRFTSPDPNVIKSYIQNFINSLGHHPKYMAIVGLPDTVPPLLVHVPEKGGTEYFTDMIYSDVDDDKMYDIALGRIVGENASYFTLNATRSITYNDLLDSSWKNGAVTYGEFLNGMQAHKYLLENRGFSVDYFPHTNNLSDGVDKTKYSIYVHEGHGWPYGISPQCLGPTSPAFSTTSGCSFGSIQHFFDPGREYKDFTAVQLARVGGVGFHAFGQNAGNNWNLQRECFLNAILYQNATLGEAYLYSQNAGQLMYYGVDEGGNYWGDYDRLSPMFYGDPALKIYMPPTQSKDKPPKVEVNGNTATLLAPSNIWVNHMPDFPGGYWYDFMAPGLVWRGTFGSFFHYDGKRFVTNFTVNGTVTNVTQQNGIPDHLGWLFSDPDKADKYRIDKHWDGTSTVYINARFYIFDYYKGNMKNSVSEISYTLDKN